MGRDVLMRPEMFTNLSFDRNTANVDISQLIIYTCRLPKFSNQSESLFSFSLFLIGSMHCISQATEEDLAIVRK